ncbi:hypothetical protein GCM10023075_56650 [Streptosporangium album]
MPTDGVRCSAESATQDAQPLVGGGAGFGGTDDELLVGVGGAGEDIPVEGEVAGDGVVEGFGAGALAGHMVRGPPLPEVGVLHRQLAHEGGQAGVVGGPPARACDVLPASPNR